MFKYLKKKLIDMGFLCHTPKSALSCQDKKDIKQYGLIHFTFSKTLMRYRKWRNARKRIFVSKRKKSLLVLY